MQEQIELFDIKKSYNLNHLRKMCRDEVKAKFPSPIDGEDYLDYLTFIGQEADLLFSERLRKIADEIEERILGPQKQLIQEVYACTKRKT